MVMVGRGVSTQHTCCAGDGDGDGAWLCACALCVGDGDGDGDCLSNIVEDNYHRW